MRGYPLVNRWHPATLSGQDAQRGIDFSAFKKMFEPLFGTLVVTVCFLLLSFLFVSLCCVLLSHTPEFPPLSAEAEQWLNILAQLLLIHHIRHNQLWCLNPS